MCRPNEQNRGDEPIADEQGGGYIYARSGEWLSGAYNVSPFDPRMTDMVLIEEARTGNERARTILLLWLRQAIYRYICKFTHHADRAEEVTQETLYRVLKNLALFKLPSDEAVPHICLLGWAQVIAKNYYLDLVRKEKSFRMEALNADYEGDFQEEASDFTEMITRREKVRKALKELPSQLTLPIQLRYWEECTLQEISEMLDVPLSTINSCIRRGLQLLRTALAEDAPQS